MSALEFDNVTVTYANRVAVNGFSDRVAPGEWVGVIGPNGAGKSSLLRAVAGLVASSGSIRVDGVSLAAMTDRERARRVAYVAQNPLIPDDMTAFDYVLLGRTPYVGYFASESPTDRAATADVIDRLRL